MRYPASEKLEIIRTVEASHLPTRQTLKMLGIPSSTYYDWYARWSDGGIDALADRSPRPGSVWNRIPDQVRKDVVDFALEHEDLTARELAVKYTDEKRYFVSESSVYRILSAEDLITAPAHVVICAADEFRAKTTRPNELWQTDFTYLKVIGWGWFYLSTILDDYSRYIIAWKLCTTMKAKDVTDTLELARDLRPGQRNNLDALCKAYEVDNSSRTLHGALLDAEILADVYLAMTGGQVALGLSIGAGQSDDAEDVEALTDRPALKVLRATPEELAAHQARLEAIQESSGECLWLEVAAD